MTIPFNKPYLSGREFEYIQEAVSSGKISGDGQFTKKCHSKLETLFGFKKTLLTTSCTDALEMASLLLKIGPGDEIIVPSFTFVSSANAFALRGATLKFIDSGKLNPNLDPHLIDELITPKTKAIVVVHYAGVACDMDAIMTIAEKHGIFVVEDAAQAINSYYKGRALGGIGHLGTYSFHETKNIISGEGGALIINQSDFFDRSEIIWEKGTNRSAFFRGEVNKYGWVDIGSSFLPSELNAAYLYAQLEALDKIQNRRIEIWERYQANLKDITNLLSIKIPEIPHYATNNGHMFYMVCESFTQRSLLINYLKSHGINAPFHYISLHDSDYFRENHDGRSLQYSAHYTDCLIRLPMYFELKDSEVDFISNCILNFKF